MYTIDIVKIIALTVSGLIFFTVIELIRRDHLKERYSLIWLAASIVLIVFSSWRGLLHFIAFKLGIYYPPSFLFLLAIAFLLVLLLYFSTVISSQSDQNKRLAQEIGILKERVNKIETKGPTYELKKESIQPQGLVGDLISDPGKKARKSHKKFKRAPSSAGKHKDV